MKKIILLNCNKEIWNQFYIRGYNKGEIWVYIMDDLSHLIKKAKDSEEEITYYGFIDNKLYEMLDKDHTELMLKEEKATIYCQILI